MALASAAWALPVEMLRSWYASGSATVGIAACRRECGAPRRNTTSVGGARPKPRRLNASSEAKVSREAGGLPMVRSVNDRDSGLRCYETTTDASFSTTISGRGSAFPLGVEMYVPVVAAPSSTVRRCNCEVPAPSRRNLIVASTPFVAADGDSTIVQPSPTAPALAGALAQNISSGVGASAVPAVMAIASRTDGSNVT